MTPAAVVSFIESPDRAASWLAYHRNSTWIDALVPPGSIVPSDHSARQITWTRCSWEEVDPQVAAPDSWVELNVADALACARDWNRGDTQNLIWPVTERWVLESSIVYAHLLLSHV